MNYTYRFKLLLEAIDLYSYKYKFFNTVEKKLEIAKFILLIHNILGKDLISKERLSKLKI